MVQAVSECHAGNLYAQLIGHGEVRDALASRRVFLRKVDLALVAVLGAPQAHAALQGAQHTVVPLTGLATLQFFEQGHGIEPGIGLQQRDDLAVPHRTERILSGAPVALWAL